MLSLRPSRSFLFEEELDPCLRVHYLLDDYVLAHLTTDFNDWTQGQVYELLTIGLNLVPPIDPHSFAPPSDVLADFLKEKNASQAEFPDEHIEGVREAHALLKDVLEAKVKPITENCFIQGSAYDFNYALSDIVPPDSVIGVRARRQDPQPGSSRLIAKFSQSHPEFTRWKSFAAIDVEELEVPEVSTGDALGSRLTIDPSIREPVIHMLRDNSLATRTSSERLFNCFMESLRRPSPPLPSLPRAETPPIFPRSRMPGGGTSGHGQETSIHRKPMDSIRKISSMISSVKVEDEDAKADHMVTIDGWEAYALPSTPLTPSLADSSSDVDDLFLPSPVSKALPIQQFVKAQMDDRLMPRTSSIGGDHPKAKLLGEGKSLREHLKPFIGRLTGPKVIFTPRSSPSLYEGMPSSLLGQPPTLLDDKIGVPPTVDGTSHRQDDCDDLDAGITKLVGHLQEDEINLILREWPSDKASELMEVPLLPEPCEHAYNLVTPPSLQSLVAAPAHDLEVPRDPFRFLKPVTGVKPLNIELSWRPFDFEHKIPTHDEMVQTTGLQELFSSGGQDRIDETEIMRILKEHHPPELPPSSIALKKEWLHRLNRQSPPAVISATKEAYFDEDSDTGVGVILTREERRRAARLGGYSDNVPDDEDGGFILSPNPHGVYTKRRRSSGKVSLPISLLAPCPPVQHSNTPEVRQDALQQPVHLGHDFAFPYPASTDDSSNTIPVAGYSSVEDDMDLADVQAIEDDDITGSFISPSMVSNRRPNSHLPFGHPADLFGCDQRLNSWSSNLPASSIPSPTQSPEPNPPVIEVFTPKHNKRHSVNASLADWMLLRPNAPPVKEQDSFAESPNTQSADPLPQRILEVPAELIDSHTLREPLLHRSCTDTPHIYLASLDILKNRPFVRALRSPKRRIRLIERDSLKDVDLVLDCDTAIILFPLRALPAGIADLKSRLETLSWRYLRLVIVFEAYTSSTLGSSSNINPHVFTTPVIKAVKKLHRELALSDAYETKRADASIHYAFALSIDHAADFILTAAEAAAQRLGTSAWVSRDWLSKEEQEGEHNLADAVGMNAFAAAMILSRVSLNEFLDLDPVERMVEFGCLVGEQRILRLNESLSLRKDYINSPSDTGVLAAS